MTTPGAPTAHMTSPTPSLQSSKATNAVLSSFHQTPPPAVASPSRGAVFFLYRGEMTAPSFPKHSRTDAELLDLMIARGLLIIDRSRALQDLQTYGYHRLGGYRYPFRLLPTSEQDPRQRKYRSDDFIKGAAHEGMLKDRVRSSGPRPDDRPQRDAHIQQTRCSTHPGPSVFRTGRTEVGRRLKALSLGTGRGVVASPSVR